MGHDCLLLVFALALHAHELHSVPREACAGQLHHHRIWSETTMRKVNSTSVAAETGSRYLVPINGCGGSQCIYLLPVLLVMVYGGGCITLESSMRTKSCHQITKKEVVLHLRPADCCSRHMVLRFGRDKDEPK